MILPLAQTAPWLTAVGIVFFLFVSIVMILIVLIQRPQGGGLGGAFGGGAAGSGQTAFGARTGDVLTWATITIFVVFLVTAALLNFAVRPDVADIPTLAPASGEPADSAVIPIAPPEATAPDAQPESAGGTAPVNPPEDGAPTPTEPSADPNAEPSTEPPAGEPAPDPDPGSGG